jgi:hypothetical protein
MLEAGWRVMPSSLGGHARHLWLILRLEANETAAEFCCNLDIAEFGRGITDFKSPFNRASLCFFSLVDDFYSHHIRDLLFADSLADLFISGSNPIRASVFLRSIDI